MEPQQPPHEKRWSYLTIGLIVLCVVCLTAVLTIVLAKLYLFPAQFTPVQLKAREEKALDEKLAVLTAPQRDQRRPGHQRQGPFPERSGGAGALEPEPYREDDARRRIQLTERELNGLLARNTRLAERLVIDLSDNLASAKLLVPLDPEFPILGGKTLRVSAGVELRYADDQPVVILRGVSIWGVPVPNAWVGGLKHINLVEEFGADRGFWRTFADGVDNIRIEDGRLTLRLKP